MDGRGWRAEPRSPSCLWGGLGCWKSKTSQKRLRSEETQHLGFRKRRFVSGFCRHMSLLPSQSLFWGDKFQVHFTSSVGWVQPEVALEGWLPGTHKRIPDKALQGSDEAFKANIYNGRQVLPTLCTLRRLLAKSIGNLEVQATSIFTLLSLVMHLGCN